MAFPLARIADMICDRLRPETTYGMRCPSGETASMMRSRHSRDTGCQKTTYAAFERASPRKHSLSACSSEKHSSLVGKLGRVGYATSLKVPRRGASIMRPMRGTGGNTVMGRRGRAETQTRPSGTFIDLFAGCGGLSVGLMSAGWRGLFAVEQDSHAFSTLSHNLIDGHSNSPHRYAWPAWLPKEPFEIKAFLRKYRKRLVELRGSVDLVAGGPPCQGFSFAGRRRKDDPRNQLFQHYVATVRALQPRMLLMENVRGISVAFHNHQGAGATPVQRPYSEHIAKSLQKNGYVVFTRLIRGTDGGVPQLRPRYILIGIRKDLMNGEACASPFHMLDEVRCRFLQDKKLPLTRPVTVHQALSDLESAGSQLIPCEDSPGFMQVRYRRPRTQYQRIMHGRLNGTAPNSLRLANHTKKTVTRFRTILNTCRRGVSLSSTDLGRFKLKKHCIVPLHPMRPSHTLTTLPDDILHYSEPRILTVREYARLQSFPDWFEFRGNYTTGGSRRRRQCPRYTQVGNAVPPFISELLGKLLARQQTFLQTTSGPHRARKTINGRLRRRIRSSI